MSYQTKLRNKNRGYMNLIVWQRAMDLFQLAWQLTHSNVPIDLKLRSQLVDAAQSVSANIAEGYGRRGINEYLQFLYVGLGSLGETLTRVIGLVRTNQISDEALRKFDELHYEVENRLSRLIQKLEQKREDGDWIARIMEDPEEYITPSLHHSITPSPGYA
ncbi:MAG: four helix bundle protein [Candidatus Udaeobacter sp.]